jgi:VWFA-related protein
LIVHARIVIIAVVVAAITIGARPSAHPQSSQTPMFRATTDIVRVDVSVTRDRRPVTGLRAADFVVKDNGVPQSIADVQFGKLPIDVTIALDVSASVKGPLLDRLRRAIAALIKDLGSADRLKLMLFDTQVQRVVDYTTDFAVVDEALRRASTGGGTALYDALSVALSSAAPADRRQLIVCFTDGMDSHTSTDPQDLAGVARRTHATLTVLPPPQPPFLKMTPSQRRGLVMMQALAALSGGQQFTETLTSDLTATFRAALDEFRSEYVLYFRPAGVEREGVHTLDVASKPGTVVRARRSYVGGG